MSHPVWAILCAFCNGDLRYEVLVTCKEHDDDEVSKQDGIQKLENLERYFAGCRILNVGHHVPEGVEEAIKNRQ